LKAATSGAEVEQQREVCRGSLYFIYAVRLLRCTISCLSTAFHFYKCVMS